MTNLDKIRAMSAEELAKNVLMQDTCQLCLHYDEKRQEFCGKDNNGCLKGFVEWLNQEVNPKLFLWVRFLSIWDRCGLFATKCEIQEVEK